MSYVDIVGDILLGLLRASREGNWHLHFSAISKIIPWCFAYDRAKYARYLPAYLTKMYSLKDKHPEVYNIFCNGEFSVQVTDQNPFGRIPVNQTIEMTINKDTQTAGGITKFRKKSGAVSTFYFTAEYLSGFLVNLSDITNTSRSSLNHSDLQKTIIEKDEKNVSAIVELFDNWIIRLKKMKWYASLQQQQRPQISWTIYSTLTTQVKKHMNNSTLTDCKAIHLDWYSMTRFRKTNWKLSLI